MKTLNINNKEINIFVNDNTSNSLPVIILNTFQKEGQEIWNICNRMNAKDFILVAISNLDWDNDLTPWECPPQFKGDTPCLGYGDNYIKELENDIMPKVKEYITNILNKGISYYGIAGYSLGGLFALYSTYKTNKFKRIVSASGSLWYPRLSTFVKDNKISNNIDKIYFSLGTKEKDTLKQTITIFEYLSKDIECIFELNRGSHHNDSRFRMAKGIKWVLE